MSAEGRVLVVGGGPAGLATAIACRLEGLPVTVVDRAKPPIDKPCGEGLMPDAVSCLASLGVALEAIADRGEAMPFRGIRYLDGERVAEARFPGRPGLGVRRTVLQRTLARRAHEAGAQLLWGVRVTGLTPGGVASDRGPIEGRWVVGADGLHSRVRRWAGLAARVDRRPPFRRGRSRGRFGARRHFAIRPWSDLVEVWWADGAEAYVTPVSPREVGIAILWSGERAGYDRLLERFPALAARLAGAPVTSRDKGAGPLRQTSRGAVRERLALVGDAAGYVDAITGEGLAVAFREAFSLAAAIKVEHLPSYERERFWIHLRPDVMTTLLLAAEARPRLRRRLIATLASDGALFARLLAVHAGEAPPSRVGVGGLVRLLRGLLAAG